MINRHPVHIEVTNPANVRRAGEAGRSFASTIGFTELESEQIALVTTELATNLVKHAGGGSIRFSLLEEQGRIGIQIESEDSGPGISNFEQALRDGYSTKRTLGTGLGTVNRFMDELEFRPGSHSGLHILCQRWRRPPSHAPGSHWLEFGAATRACRLAVDNGDTFVLRQWEGYALAGVIDGLGHGPLAKRASNTARQYIEQHFDQPLESIFRGVGRACQSTRGVVMGLARFDATRHKLAVANIGNIEIRLLGGAEPFRPMVRRGVLGLNAPKPLITEHPWTAASVLAIHSDGLRTSWRAEDIPDMARHAPGVIALELLRQAGKIEDDATVVVARSATR